MIRKLFISDECMLNFMDITSKQKYKITLSLLLSEDANFILSPLQFQADSIWVQEELSGVSDTHYIGELGLFSDKLISGHQLISDKNKIGKVTINAMKQQKIFGQDTLKTWDVFLGDIHLP